MKGSIALCAACLLLMFAAPAHAADGQAVKIKVSAGGRTLTATLEDNATTRAFLKKLPITLHMEDLYGREMCHHLDEALPADDVQNRGYETGEIIYWPPRRSFVIMYRQNGERFGMQRVGRIDSGVEIFERSGNMDVTFELLNE